MPTPQRILIVRLSAIGDVIHALPALQLLRRALPHAFIGWVVEDFASAFLENHPGLDRLHIIPKKRWRGAFWKHLGPEIRPFVRELRDERYDVAIDFQGLTKSGVAAWLSNAPLRIGFGDQQGAELNKLFTNRKVIPPPDCRHIIERNVALLSALGITERPERPEIVFTGEELATARQALGGFAKQPVVGLNVGAGWETKRWSAQYWSELARLIDQELKLKSVLLWGSEAEKNLAADVISLSGAAASDYLRMADRTSLRVSGALIQQLRAYVGGDTGATHLAAALGVPTVAIFGASDAQRNGPYWPRSLALQANTEACIPCWKRECRSERHLACLMDVKPEQVLSSLQVVLQ